jgi:hypothetical protein
MEIEIPPTSGSTAALKKGELDIMFFSELNFFMAAVSLRSK